MIEEQASDFQRARERIEEALSLPVENATLQAALHRRAGCIDARTGRFDEGEDHLKAALGLAEGSGNRDQQASVLNNLTSLYTVAGRLEEAAVWLDRAFTNDEELVHSKQMCWLQSARAFLLYAQDRISEAVEEQSEAVERWTQTGFAGTEVLGRLMRAAMLLELGKLDDVRVDLMRVEQLGTAELGRDALFMCGLLHHALGGLDQASERYQQALNGLSEEAAAARAPILVMHAVAVFDGGDLEMSRRLLESARASLPAVEALVILGRARCLGAQPVGGQAAVDGAHAAIMGAPFTEEGIRLRVSARVLKG